MSRKRKGFSQESSGGKKSSGNDFKSKKSKKQLDPAKAQHKNNKNAVKEQPPAVLVGGGGDAPWSKSKKKRMRLLKSKLLKKQEQQGGVSDSAAAMDTKNSSSSRRNESSTPKRQAEPATSKSTSATASSSLPLPLSGGSRLSALQESFKARLSGSRFRLLNEELYTTTSSTAFERFSAHPELYDEYHDGFRSQVEHWPVNPVDVIVGRLKKDADIFDETKSNSSNNKKIVVADFGCGDADLAKQLLQVRIPLKSGKRQKGGGGSGSTTSSTWCPFHVHSFDLVSRSDLVTACDMSNVPLQKGTVDVAVFCLSLMGTNLADFVREAHRVLKSNGRLKIAEVKSRFSSSSSGSNSKNNNKKSRNDSTSRNSGRQDEEKEFVRVLKQLGFECTRTDRSNKMFVVFELRKNGKAPDQNVEYTAKPCIYKRR